LFGTELALLTIMNDPLPNLLKLQAMQFGEIKEKDIESRMAELKAQIPAQILCHYDRLVARGKKGVAVVRNQVCSGCHMKLPIGTINTLMQGSDIRLCDSCGRYLYLPNPAETQFLDNVAASKPAPKTRKRKALTHAAL
jgi:predicted  nucleic acid-binding Zn-ribbon protein